MIFVILVYTHSLTDLTDSLSPPPPPPPPTKTGHKLDRVGSGGAPKSLHVPARPPSSSGKHKSGSLENSGGSSSDGDGRVAAEEEGKGGRGHTHRGDQEAPPKRYNVCVRV